MESTNRSARSASAEREDDVQRSSDSSYLNLLQPLKDIAHQYPSLWPNAASLDGIMVGLDELEHGEDVTDYVRETARHVRQDLLNPLIRLFQDPRQEQEIFDQKMHQASLAMLLLFEECNRAKQECRQAQERRNKQAQFTESLVRDLDETVKALERNRQAQRRGKLLLVAREEEIKRLKDERREMLRLLVEAGPWQLRDWVIKELAESGVEPGPDFEVNWSRWVPSEDDLATSFSPTSIKSTRSSRTSDDVEPAGKDVQLTGDKCKEGLLRAFRAIVWQEVRGTCHLVLEKGFNPFVLPMAWISFWFRLTSRVAGLTEDCLSGVMKSQLGFVPFHLI